jgi:hypothetical protein
VSNEATKRRASVPSEVLGGGYEVWAESGAEPPMAESQLVGLQNMRVLLEDTRLLVHNLAYHRRAKIEARLDLVLFEVERQIEELRANRG